MDRRKGSDPSGISRIKVVLLAIQRKSSDASMALETTLTDSTVMIYSEDVMWSDETTHVPGVKPNLNIIAYVV